VWVVAWQNRQKTAADLNPKEAPPEKVLLPSDKIGNQKKRSSSSSSSKFLLLGKSVEELQDLAAAHGEVKTHVGTHPCHSCFTV
jgi:hypothetical protein